MIIKSAPYLVGGSNPSEKSEFVNWDDEIPNWMEIHKEMFQITNHQQPNIICYTYICMCVFMVYTYIYIYMYIIKNHIKAYQINIKKYQSSPAKNATIPSRWFAFACSQGSLRRSVAPHSVSSSRHPGSPGWRRWGRNPKFGGLG